MIRYVLIFVIFSLPKFISGQQAINKDSLIILKSIEMKKIESEFDAREKERLRNEIKNDSIKRASEEFYKSGYCLEKLEKYKKDLMEYHNFEDSLIQVVKKFNLNEGEYDYFLNVNFPWHCTGEHKDNECGFFRMDLSEKAKIGKVYKFGNKDGSSGNTIYKRQ